EGPTLRILRNYVDECHRGTARDFVALERDFLWHITCTKLTRPELHRGSRAPAQQKYGWRLEMAKALAAWLLVAAVTAGSAVTPSETVQSAVSRAVTIVQDAELARPVNADKRRAELRRVAEELFDFNEMARRALARHWAA